jgi:3-methyladenine DNA glycosylase/8-oxoguanine DNA glycosylase
VDSSIDKDFVASTHHPAGPLGSVTDWGVPRLDLDLDGPLDLPASLGPLVRGHGDRTIRIAGGRAWWATRTVDGVATLGLTVGPGRLTAEAWGPGADRLLERVPRMFSTSTGTLAADDDRRIAALARRAPGVRILRTEAVFDALVAAILEQKVTGTEAHRAWHGLVRRYGEPAPGPHNIGLRVLPAPATLAALPYWSYHVLGLEQRRAELIRVVARRVRWFEAIVDLPLPDAYARLRSVPGIGPWTAAEVGARALGDVDAVSVGDFHLPHIVAYALAGEPRGDDARMLELLEPFSGKRALVVRLLELSGIQPPRYGPRLAPRRIEGI